MQLRLQLQTITRGSQSISEYLIRIKGLSDQLAAIRNPVAEEALVLNILRGLAPDYNAFVTSINTRGNPVSFTDSTICHLAMNSYSR